MRYLILLFLFASVLTLQAQIEATTKDGKVVILNDDGTWKHKEDSQAGSSLPADLDNCDNWIKVEEDKVTGEKMTTSKEGVIISDDGGKTGFGITWFLTTKSPSLSIIAVGAGACVDTGAKINILFADGSRLELRNDRKFNCDGAAAVYFLGVFGKKNELNLLASKKIDTMRVWTSKSYVEKNFTEEQAVTFMKTASCMLSTAESKGSKK
jgi:hypothetical protein